MEPRPQTNGEGPRHAADVDPYLLERRTTELLGMPAALSLDAIGLV